MPPDGEPPQDWEGFVPLRPGARAKRVAMLVAGPLVWVVALVVLGRTVEHDDMIEFGLLTAVVSFVVAFALLLLAHSVRVRNERRR